MTELYVVWEFSKLNGEEGIKKSKIDVDVINAIHFANPGTMDWYDWMNLGLFFDEFMLGQEEYKDMLHIHIYGFYRTDEEATKAYSDLSKEFIMEKINVVMTPNNKEVN